MRTPYDRRMTDEAMIEQIHRNLERFERQQERRRRVFMWGLIPYLAGGILLGTGAADTLNAGMIGTFGKLAVGFVLIMAFQWIVPYVQERMRESLTNE